MHSTMLKIRFRLRNLFLLVAILSVLMGLSIRWYQKSLLQYEAIVQLSAPRDTGFSEFDYPLFSFTPDYMISRTEDGHYNLIEPIPNKPDGISRILTLVFDERMVCNSTLVNFIHQPGSADVALVKNLKGVERITLGTADENILSQWRNAFPNVDVIPFGHGLDMRKLSTQDDL